MIRTVLEKLAGWIRSEWEAASYTAATQGVSDGINKAIRDLTQGTITAEIKIDGGQLHLGESDNVETVVSIPPEQIDGLRKKADAIELAEQYGIEIDADGTLAAMKKSIHAATVYPVNHQTREATASRDFPKGENRQ